MNINYEVYKAAGFSHAQIDSLSALLEVADLHWITLNETTGIYELVLDNQMFSTFRQCPAHFVEAYIKGLSLKGEGSRAWPLDFGIIFHKMMEEYYMTFRNPTFDMQKWGIGQAQALWVDMNMDFHSEHKEFKSIGGMAGFCGMLIGYTMRFGPDNERLRVIGTEISFGKAKEVFLGSIWVERIDLTRIIVPQDKITVPWLNCYLSGRIDVLVDDGNFICPLDHKTMGSFRSDPTMKFGMDEGPTGYIYAVSKILPEFLKSIGKEDVLIKRSTNKIIMNYISKSIPKEGERFKRDSIMKTTEQLEAYRQRMLLTSEDIFRMLVRFADTGYVWRDTSKCNNWFMHDCLYLPIHRQNSRANELVMINSMYEKNKIWNTEEV